MERDDCIYKETCPGAYPVAKPRHSRRYPYDLYFPRYCPYCPDYKPQPKETVVYMEHPDITALKAQVQYLQGKILSRKPVKRYKRYI